MIDWKEFASNYTAKISKSVVKFPFVYSTLCHREVSTAI